MILSRTHNRMQRNFLLFYLKNKYSLTMGYDRCFQGHKTIVSYIMLLPTIHYMYIQVQVMTVYW